MSTSANGHIHRYTASARCPVCGGSEHDRRGQGTRCWGFLSGDGAWARCSREEHSDGCEYDTKSSAWVHRIGGPCRCGTEHAPTPPGDDRGLGTGKRDPVVATYNYHGPDGALRFQVQRKRSKKFLQRQPNGMGGWVYTLKDPPVERVLYKLPELLAADPDRILFFVEGEKDAERLYKQGQIATTSPQGAEAPGRKHWEAGLYANDLAGRHVVVLPDNDAPGRELARLVAEKVGPGAASLKVIDLPGLAVGGDVSDWLDRGHTIKDLLQLVEAASPWSPTAATTAPARDEAVGPPPEVNGGKPQVGTSRRRRLTDTGNAERLVDRHGKDIRHVHLWKKYLHWDGTRWRIDNRGTMQRLAKETVRSIYAEAAAEPDDDKRKAIVAHAVASESSGRRKAMVEMAASEDGIPAEHEEFDRHPMLLNLPNGTLDLKTGRLRTHRRGDLLTALAPVPYDPKATCPVWDATLLTIFAGNEALVRFWQRLCGLALTGSVAEQILPIPFGKGANGKSTLLTVLLELLGADYAMKAPPNFLTMSKGDRHPTELADLFRKRLVVAIETGEGARINEVLIKELTGSDRIRARRMHEDFWEFDPTHKVMLCTNHKPVVKGTDHAIWRRLHLVPFSVTIPKAEQDTDLPNKLREEYRGILRWCVRGCLDWQAEGLQAPSEVTDATDTYRKEQDTLQAFIDEHCVVLRGVKTKATPLYERYKAWAGAMGEEVMSQRKFGEALAEKGFEKKTSNGTWYHGLGLRSEDGDENY